MTKIDIHNSKKRIEYAKATIQKRFSEDNTKTACRFLDRLRLDNKSHGRISNYAECIQRILEIKDDKKIENWSKEEIEQIHKTIADSDYENSVKKDTLLALKRLYHYTAHDEIADKTKGMDYDPLVEWITPGSFKDRYSKIQPRDLLTDEELLQLIQAIKKIGGKYVKRNIAIIFVLLEGAYRPGELLNIQIGGIEFEENFVRIHTTGKTGPKSLTLVASYGPIKEWLVEHPKSNDPEAFLFYHDNEDGLIPYQRLTQFLRKATRLSRIKKRVWPYLFRHTALTEYSKILCSIHTSKYSSYKFENLILRILFVRSFSCLSFISVFKDRMIPNFAQFFLHCGLAKCLFTLSELKPVLHLYSYICKVLLLNMF